MKTVNFYTRSIFSYQLFCLIILTFGFTYTLNAQQFVNLLKNPGMNTDNSHWILELEDGIGPVLDPTAGINETAALRTGIHTTISQYIDLVAIGYSTDFLDSSPIIRFSDWIKGSGSNTSDRYGFYITLVGENSETLAHYFSTDYDWIISSNEWQQVTHSFINYGPGLRGISILRQGLDVESNPNKNEGIIMESAHISIANHLINPNGKTGDFSGWTIDDNESDGWIVENEALFRTSHYRTSKSQTVDLLELGYTEDQLDSEPIIKVWEFYFGFDGPLDGSGYDDKHFLNVELRGSSGNVIASFNSGDLICEENAKWVGHTFTDYGPGVREVYVQHGGEDSESWAGHYGSQVNGTQMTLEFLTTNTNETEENNFQMSITPNVVNQDYFFNLQFDNQYSGKFKVVLRDISGIIAASYDYIKSAGEHNQEISIAGLKNGMYLVSVELEGYIETKRLIIQ